MCRLWPDVRCSTHPSQKVRQTFRKKEAARVRLMKIQAEYETWKQEVPNWEHEELNITLLERVEATEATLEEAKVKHEEALREWDMTAKGREALQEVADDETQTLPARVDAAARKEAGQHRAKTQRSLRAPMEAEDLDEETKFALLSLNLRKSKQEVENLRARNGEIDTELAYVKTNWDEAKKAGDEEVATGWQKHHARLTTEKTLNKKKVEQLLTHIAKTEQHMAKMRARLERHLDKLERLTDRSIQQAVQYLL